MIEFFLVGFLLAVSPGPDFLLIARNTLVHGRKTGFTTFAGNRAGFCVHILLAVFGLSLAIKASPALFNAIRVLGAAYLLYLGIRNVAGYFRRVEPGKQDPSAETMPSGRAFKEGFLTNLLNPKVGLFFLSLFPQLATPAMLEQAPVGIALSFFIGNSTWWVLLIAILGLHNVRHAVLRFQRAADLVFGVIFIGFGLRIAVEVLF
jgi:RhtB (resistance to homoserine/threonine) family protein